ncbi:MAG: hypothetical protein SAJ12_16120 [Jaaginema sp. PMC 1079.18]|nr:hypothetical protein [Jaaginema sp. PMC 1080.18]MEC4852511.1 hypothetical protein [Jaaginema sp. PMC 1079.18]MEC4865394.1 hypothetical protein [Jaaginema sp. PMC 1078.18]
MSDRSLDYPFQRLREVRKALLNLHKALLESEKIVYEKKHGRIQSKGEFFRLVVDHEWFGWLRPISQFIVKIDEALGGKEPATLNEVKGLLSEAKVLLHPAESGTAAEQRYYQAIQRDPNVAFMHSQIAEVLNPEV